MKASVVPAVGEPEMWFDSARCPHGRHAEATGTLLCDEIVECRRLGEDFKLMGTIAGVLLDKADEPDECGHVIFLGDCVGSSEEIGRWLRMEAADGIVPVHICSSAAKDCRAEPPVDSIQRGQCRRDPPPVVGGVALRF